jgi:hypothetical protein
MNKNIVKKNNFTNITISLFIVLAGIVITFLPFPHAKLLGSIMILAGIITLSLSKKTLIHSPSGNKIISYIYFFPLTEKGKIRSMCEKGEFEMLNSLSKTEQGLQMEIYISNDGNYSAIQLYEYIPYKYEVCSPLYEYEGERSQKLAHYIRTLSV